MARLRRVTTAWVSAVLLAPVLVPVHAGDGPPFRRTLPPFTLADPHGRPVDRDDLLGHGVALVVTAPTWGNSDAQEGWSRHLKGTRPDDDSLIVFLEDMEPSWFEETALERMREAYVPGELPILVIDPEGEVRERFGVEEDETVLLVYDREGGLVHVETGAPTKERAEAAWRALREAARAT